MAIRLTNGQRWDRLYRLRRARSWSLRQLAQELQFSYPHVRDVEAGACRVTEEFIDRACRVFGITDSWELERTVPPGQMSNRSRNYPSKAAAS